MKKLLFMLLTLSSCWKVFTWDVYDDPDVHLDLNDLAKKYGFDGVDIFYPTTKDGYIVAVVRLLQKGANQLQPILLVHGLSACAESFFASKEESPAIVFGKAGYDVWILSGRGTNYSRNHTRWNATTDREFWMYSWQEMGLFDLPEAIDVAFSHNVNEKIILLGHSAGSSVIFVTLADVPGYDEKTLLSIHWGVSVYHDECIGIPLLSNVCQMEPLLSRIMDSIGWVSFFPTMKIREFFVLLCSYNIFHEACNEAAYFLLHTSKLIGHRKVWTFTVTKAICGGSMRELYHYMQVGRTGRFARYDYGPKENLRIYNSTQPPLFHLENVNSPAVLWCGVSDWFCSPGDVKKLQTQLKNVESIDFKGKEIFRHIDFIVAKDMDKLMYKDLFKILKKYSGSGNETIRFI